MEFVLSGSSLRCSDYSMSPCVTGYSRLEKKRKDNSLCLLFSYVSLYFVYSSFSSLAKHLGSVVRKEAI